MSKSTLPRRIIINTVGASAIWNIQRLKEKAQSRGIDLEKLNSSLEILDDGKEAAQVLLQIMKNNYSDPLYEIIPAEVSSLNGIGANPANRLYFLAGTRTDSKPDQGAVCGRHWNAIIK